MFQSKFYQLGEIQLIDFLFVILLFNQFFIHDGQTNLVHCSIQDPLHLWTRDTQLSHSGPHDAPQALVLGRIACSRPYRSQIPPGGAPSPLLRNGRDRLLHGLLDPSRNRFVGGSRQSSHLIHAISGTGLHTFVLYLGPHIAKITLYSYECNSIPLMSPSKWAVEQFSCPKDAEGVSFLEILMNVQFEAFLWGLGTAIGELPPYFVARAAALANQNSEELEELKKKTKKNVVDRAKLLIYNQLQRHAFMTVLVCASIPNPLFDLAGLTCGHFMIPFLTFFGATSIGKAVVKVHLQVQMLFVILIFSKEHVESLVQLVGTYLPFLSQTLTSSLEKQKAVLHDPTLFKEGEKPLVAQLWDYFILGMIVFFLVSIINSLVGQYCEEQEQKEKEKEGKKQN